MKIPNFEMIKRTKQHTVRFFIWSSISYSPVTFKKKKTKKTSVSATERVTVEDKAELDRENDTANDLSSGQIAGIVIAGIVICCIIAVALLVIAVVLIYSK